MEDLSVRRLDSEEPVGAMIRRIVGEDAFDLDLPEREVDDPIDFTSPHYGEDDQAGAADCLKSESPVERRRKRL